MAFHPYPRVIPSVFNRSGFGPPRGLTPASPCPWIAHPASRPRHATLIALFRLAFAAARCPLTSPHAATRRLILQKARGHRRQNGSRCLGAHGFRRCFTPLSGCFSPFPRGTGSLSVIGECSALEGGPPCFGPDFTCPALLGTRLARRSGLSRTGPLPCSARLSRRLPLARRFATGPGAWAPPGLAVPQHRVQQRPQALPRARVWARLRFRSPLLAESRLISLPRGT